MKTKLNEQIQRYKESEAKLQESIHAWRRESGCLHASVRSAEFECGLGRAPIVHQVVWSSFRISNSVVEAAYVLRILEERGLTIGDFVEALAVHGTTTLAVHALWRKQPNQRANQN